MTTKNKNSKLTLLLKTTKSLEKDNVQKKVFLRVIAQFETKFIIKIKF